jgi:arylsulfatase A-like enzyme
MNWPGATEAGSDAGVDFAQPIADGPVGRGFATYFGVNIPNWGPFCFIENDRCVGTLSERMPKDNPYGDAEGPMVPGWDARQILPTITDRACEYISGRRGSDQPFFVYFPLTSPHTPLAVNAPWQGRSGLNTYADFVMETDAMVGRVVEALDESGQAENTLFIFTSDNGCAPYIGVDDLERQGHYPSAWFRGYKSDAWDGGHRIPFVARWPGVIAPGSKCAQLACLTDLMATCAELIGGTIPSDAGEDSVSILPLLRGEECRIRDTVVSHSINGRFALRENRWKLVLCPGSGGWTEPRDETALAQGLPPVQLYDMEADPAEASNLAQQEPAVVQRLTRMLEQMAAAGCTTPGPARSNDVAVDLFKGAPRQGEDPDTE